MRLTIEKRNAIVGSETNKKFYDVKKKLHKEIIDYLDKEVSKQIEKDVLDSGLVERGYINTCNSVQFIHSDREFAEELTKKVKNNRYAGTISIHNSYPRKRFQSHFELKITKSLESKIKKYADKCDEEKEFKSNLRRVLNSFSTTKKLVSAVPELEIHFKDERTASAVIPYDQINNIKKQLVRP